MNTTTATEPATVTPAQSTKQPLGEFGTGRYSNIGRELYRDAQRVLGFTPEKSDAIARAYMSDIGRAGAEVTKVKFGKPNKDGWISLGESAKAKFVKVTTSMQVARIVVALDEARKLGVEKFGKIELDSTEGGLASQLEQF